MLMFSLVNNFLMATLYHLMLYLYTVAKKTDCF